VQRDLNISTNDFIGGGIAIHMLNRRELLARGGIALGGLSLVAAEIPINAEAKMSVPAIQNFPLQIGPYTFNAISCGPTTGELVLCLHGFPEFKEAWTPILQSLGAAGYYAVAVDQRGYSAGARPTSVADYALANLVSDVVDFAAAIEAMTGTGSKFHLVGHDMGGSVAWGVAGQHPELLLSTTILSTPHKNAFVAAYTANGNPQQAASSYISILQGSGGEQFMLANNGANFYGSYNGTVPDAALFVSRFQNDQGALTAALSWYRAEDFTTADGAIVSAPVLYIWSTADPFLLKECAANTANFCTGQYQFVQLPAHQHFLADEVPQDITTLLLQQFTAKLT
jgi:pimeloyl-ACP methyl ester carboxylesterase